MIACFFIYALGGAYIHEIIACLICALHWLHIFVTKINQSIHHVNYIQLYDSFFIYALGAYAYIRDENKPVNSSCKLWLLLHLCTGCINIRNETQPVNSICKLWNDCLFNLCTALGAYIRNENQPVNLICKLWLLLHLCVDWFDYWLMKAAQYNYQQIKTVVIFYRSPTVSTAHIIQHRCGEPNTSAMITEAREHISNYCHHALLYILHLCTGCINS